MLRKMLNGFGSPLRKCFNRAFPESCASIRAIKHIQAAVSWSWLGNARLCKSSEDLRAAVYNNSFTSHITASRSIVDHYTMNRWLHHRAKVTFKIPVALPLAWNNWQLSLMLLPLSLPAAEEHLWEMLAILQEHSPQ